MNRIFDTFEGLGSIFVIIYKHKVKIIMQYSL